MKHALIEPGGRVAQVEPSPFPVAPPLEWVACGDDVRDGWTYVDGEFIPPQTEKA